MLFLFVFVALAAIASVYMLQNHGSRRNSTLESLLDELNPLVRTRLLAYYDRQDGQGIGSGYAQWAAIGGMSGAAALCRNAQILVRLATMVGHPEQAPATNDLIRRRAALIRVLVPLCLIECVAGKCLRSLDLPRFAALHAIEQYEEICSDIRAVVECWHPELICHLGDIC